MISCGVGVGVDCIVDGKRTTEGWVRERIRVAEGLEGLEGSDAE